MTDTRSPAPSLPSFFIMVLTISAALGVTTKTGLSVTVVVIGSQAKVGGPVHKGSVTFPGCMLQDISQPVTARTSHFPGDEPFSCGWTVDEPRLHVGWVRTSPHVGTHVDAPFHYGVGETR